MSGAATSAQRTNGSGSTAAHGSQSRNSAPRNGIPAGQSGQCYYSQPNPVITVPLSQLRQGDNTLEGTSGGQTCYSFNWGAWGWYGTILRVYYGPGKGAITGGITSPAPSTTVYENPVITVNGSSPAGISKIEVFASYEGFDPDGDGIYGGYQHSYHRLKTESQMLTKFHVGTTVNPPVPGHLEHEPGPRSTGRLREAPRSDPG